MKKAMTKGVLVQHLRIYEVPVTLRENEDMLDRPALVADDVNGLDLRGLTIVQKSAPKGKKQTVFNKVRIYKLK